MLLKLRDVVVSYGTAAAVTGVTLGGDEGVMVAIIGSNGAGKSTILKAISGQVPLTSGEIWYESRRIDGMTVQEIAKLGIIQVPQGRQLFPQMTIIENLKVGSYLQKDKQSIKKDIDSVFEHFPKLKGMQNRIANTLSGGEQQMLAIGRGLMAKPRLLMLDEPSLGLAPVLVEEIVRIISEINERGVSIVLVEQNALMALRICHKGYVLELGRVVLEGEGKVLLSDESVKRAYLGF